ncbi:MAG: glycosyltransferase family 2 protein [Bacilli bacterium]
MKKITLIIPCYNEEEMIDIFYSEIQQYLNPNYDWWMVFIDDGSKDKTLDKMRLLANLDHQVKYLSFSRNFGKESAMLAGLELAKRLNSDAAIIIDADLQHPPMLIADMLTYYEQGYKHIYARQRSRKNASFLKTLFARTFYRLYAFLTGFKDMQNGAVDFCLIDRDAIDAFLSIKDYTRFTKGIFSFVGFEKKCLDFDCPPRVAGTTKWSFIKLWRYAILGIKQFSRIYVLIPSLVSILIFLVLVVDVLMGFLHQNFNFLALRIDIFSFLIVVTVRYLMILLYDVRDQGLHRPIYIKKETNIDDELHS